MVYLMTAYKKSLFYKQYTELNDKDYTLSDKDLGSKNKVSLTGKNGEMIEVVSMDNNNILEFSVIENGKNVIINKTEDDVRNYLNIKL
ncbi:MAG: hypothetical protein MJ182_06760 [Treponema sp.]|nr:hypothetical protein [Treponema sp.]